MKKSLRFKERSLSKLAELLSTGYQMTKAVKWEIKTNKQKKHLSLDHYTNSV